jgi:hypothetical protein
MQRTNKNKAPDTLEEYGLGRVGTALAIWPMAYGILKVVAHLTSGDNDPATQVLTGPSSYLDGALASLLLSILFGTSVARLGANRRAWQLILVSLATLGLQTLLVP